MEKKEKRLWQIASPTIAEVLEQFLEEQQTRVKSDTFRKYADIVYLFRESMNGYASQCLDEEQTELFNHFFGLQGEDHREFCDIFGPSEILGNVSEFLNYFMIRKVMCGKEMLKAAGTVITKLVKWLAEHGHVDSESAEDYADQAGRASKELPAMEELSELLWKYAINRANMEFQETAEGYFSVRNVENGRIHLEDLGGMKVVLTLPLEIASRCKSGWSINLALGKTKGQWKILEVGNVYPY